MKRRLLASCFAVLVACLAAGAAAQQPDAVLVGEWVPNPGGFTFKCMGLPNCSGEFVVTYQDPSCSNPVHFQGTIQITVSDPSIPGPVSGQGTATADWGWSRNADGTCVSGPSNVFTQTIEITGTSDGSVATVSDKFTAPAGDVHRQSGGTLARASETYANAQVTGSVAGATGGGGDVAFTFTCVGTPLCTGTYGGKIRQPDCSNSFPFSGSITLSGFDIANGSLGGTVVLQNGDPHDQRNADGTCSVSSVSDFADSYSGRSSGGGGTLSIATSGGAGSSIPGSFSVSGVGGTPAAGSTPPFQVTVQSRITSTTASATAQVVPPAADVGKTVSLYVFAFAPRSLVKSLRLAAAKDDTTGGCVLAQLDPATGQLRAASASNLTPAITGPLSAQGQSLTILDNASTVAIAGSSFFVGYAGDSSTMIGDGINVNALRVPGTQQCPSVFPKTPGALSGLWYAGEQESGWGIDFTQRGAHVFAAFYTYDGSGQPKWYVASDCAMAAPALASGRCTGDLYEFTGSPLFGIGTGGSHNAPAKAGTLQVDFADASRGTMSYTVGSVTRSMPILRDVFATGAVAPTIDYTDLWYAGEQSSGWGIALSHQYDVMFLAWFVYDAAGKPVWYTASACRVVASGNGCTGELYQVTGPPFGPTFDRMQVHVTPVGSVGVTFIDPNTGTISYTVNGTTASKALVRLVF